MNLYKNQNILTFTIFICTINLYSMNSKQYVNCHEKFIYMAIAKNFYLKK